MVGSLVPKSPDFSFRIAADATVATLRARVTRSTTSLAAAFDALDHSRGPSKAVEGEQLIWDSKFGKIEDVTGARVTNHRSPEGRYNMFEIRMIVIGMPVNAERHHGKSGQNYSFPFGEQTHRYGLKCTTVL